MATCPSNLCWASSNENEEKIGCSADDCRATQPRCSSCNYNFVEEIFSICENCKDVNCDYCGQKIHEKALRVPVYKNEELVETKVACFICVQDNEKQIHNTYVKGKSIEKKLKGERQGRTCSIYECDSTVEQSYLGNTYCNKCKWKMEHNKCPCCSKDMGHEELEASGMCLACCKKSFKDWKRSALNEWLADSTSIPTRGLCACGTIDTIHHFEVCDNNECIEIHDAQPCKSCRSVYKDTNTILPSWADSCLNCDKNSLLNAYD